MCGICGCGTSDALLPPEMLTAFRPSTSNNPRMELGRPASVVLAGDAQLKGSGGKDQQQAWKVIEIEKSLQEKNNGFAQQNRQNFTEHRQLVFNLLSSPGSGKTSLLVRTLKELAGSVSMSVIEGDQQSSLDADRIRATGAQAYQVNTGKGCHLEAQQVEEACRRLSMTDGSILFIENVGNLVCPAGFDLGENLRVVVLSVTEGEDKPLKYPDAFCSADWVLINKTDLLPYLDFDMDLCCDYINKVNPRAKILGVSAKSGEGMQTWYSWIRDNLTSSSSTPRPQVR